MLVLSRREGECIRVGDSVVFTVVRVAGDKVRVGIQAPSNVVVLRGELEPYTQEVRINSVADLASPTSSPFRAAS